MARQSQQQVARALGVTQGHYSKVITSKTPLSDKLKVRMEAWLAERGTIVAGDAASRRMHELAASIRRECMELMHLVGRATNISGPRGSSAGRRGSRN
jgi:transcriptional regulator with XRE-family HTH domain